MFSHSKINQILTETKTVLGEKITGISKVRFDGTVHNLKLATPDGSLVPAQANAMYANGILVGDLTMQSKMQDKKSEIVKQKTLENLPPEWKEDYLNSLK